jgi:hypothetical protein
MMKSTIFAVMILLVTGCGTISIPVGSQNVAPTQPVATVRTASINDIDPCNLLDQPTATLFFSIKANAGVKTVGTNSASCSYTSSQKGDQMALNVLFEDGTAKDSAAFTSGKTASVTAITGMGDDAYYNKSTFVLTVAQGQWIVALHGTQKGTNAGFDMLARPIHTVTTRLPH